MAAPIRRHRASDTPVGSPRVIAPDDIDERYIAVLQLLEPYYHYKYLTLPWLHYISGLSVEHSVFRKYLGYLRQAPNRYLICPEQQLASPNVDRKTLVYALGERGYRVLHDRGIVAKGNNNNNNKSASHRSNSYYHEIIVDLGYYAPLKYLVRSDANLRMLGFSDLMNHRNVPESTRTARDPLLIRLKQSDFRFDGTPHLLVRKREDGISLPLGIPGIQVDRGTENFSQMMKHLVHAIEYVEGRHHERQWGFDNCVVPFLFTKTERMQRAMRYVRDLKKRCPYLLFQTIPDLGLVRHFPKPEHYGREHQYTDGEPLHSPSIRIFTNPWQRVDYPDFYLDTFVEKEVS